MPPKRTEHFKRVHTDLRHIGADARRLRTQLFLLLLHLGVRFGPQVVGDNLVAEHRDALLREFLRASRDSSETAPRETHGHVCAAVILTARSSSRSGDRSSGIMTWLRKDGVFSFLSSLLMVFS